MPTVSKSVAEDAAKGIVNEIRKTDFLFRKQEFYYTTMARAKMWVERSNPSISAVAKNELEKTKNELANILKEPAFEKS